MANSCDRSFSSLRSRRIWGEEWWRERREKRERPIPYRFAFLFIPLPPPPPSFSLPWLLRKLLIFREGTDHFVHGYRLRWVLAQWEVKFSSFSRLLYHCHFFKETDAFRLPVFHSHSVLNVDYKRCCCFKFVERDKLGNHKEKYHSGRVQALVFTRTIYSALFKDKIVRIIRKKESKAVNTANKKRKMVLLNIIIVLQQKRKSNV